MRLVRWRANVVVVAALALVAPVSAATAVALSAPAAPRCYGAASRDPQRSCSNPGLATAVIPTPWAAAHATNAPCTVIAIEGLVHVCAFGAGTGRATGTIGLVGDSHAQHWRGALEVVAQRKRWRGLSVTHPGCPLSRATKLLPEPDRGRCVRWNAQVLRWLRARRDIHTLFVSELNGRTGVAAYLGRSGFAAQVAGYRDAWSAIPASVRRIVVIRDTPRPRRGARHCVEQAMRARRPAGRACATSRAAALPPDPAAVAATGSGNPRVRLVDLTSFMCDAARCYPVVGGALVYKDYTHLTKAFAATLGPYLERAFDRVAG